MLEAIGNLFATQGGQNFLAGLTNLFGRNNAAASNGASVTSMAGTPAGKLLGLAMNGNSQNTPANGGSLPGVGSFTPYIDSEGYEVMTENGPSGKSLTDLAYDAANKTKPNAWWKDAIKESLTGAGAGIMSAGKGTGKNKEEQGLTVVPVFSSRMYTPTFLGRTR